MPIVVYIVCGCRHVIMAKLRNNGRDPLLTNQNIHSFPTSCFHFRVWAHLSELGPRVAETQVHFPEYWELRSVIALHAYNTQWGKQSYVSRLQQHWQAHSTQPL